MANLDQALFLAVNGFVGTLPALDRAAALVASDYLVPKALALAIVAMWFMEPDRDARMRHQIGAIAALTAMSLASLTVFIINIFYFRPRPFADMDVNLLFYRPTDSSFPSNAAAAAFGLAFGVFCGVRRDFGIVLIAAAALYGAARIYVGVHYPADVAGAIIIAAAATWAAFKMRDALMPVLTLAIRLARVFRLA